MSSTVPEAPVVDTGAVIPEGPASKYGKVATAVLAIAALVAAVLHGDHTAETLVALGGAVVTLVTYMGGRYAQAAALFRDVASPAAPLTAIVKPPPAIVLEAPAPPVTFAGASSSAEAPPGPDLDDGAHALTDGDPAEPVGGPALDEAATAPDPAVEDGAR